jgi:CheY-like chemotaxis protein
MSEVTGIQLDRGRLDRSESELFWLVICLLVHGLHHDAPENVMDPKKILIVDDDSVTLDVLTRVLNDLGYDILRATDGSQASTIARQERPDLILLDILFPPDVAHGGGIAWDGFLIIDWLRRMDEAKDIPIFVMTMGDEAQYKNKAFAKGAAAFFHKPINYDDLAELVKKTIGESSTDTNLMVRLNVPPGTAS